MPPCMCLGGGLQVTQKVQTSGDVAGRIKPCMKLIRANMPQASVYKQLGSMLSCFAYPIFKYRFATFFRGEQGLLPYLEVKTVSTVMFLEFQSTTQGLLVIPSPYFEGRLSAKPLKKRKQGFALSLVLKMRVLGRRKGPILQSGRINCLQLYPAPRSRYNT